MEDGNFRIVHFHNTPYYPDVSYITFRYCKVFHMKNQFQKYRQTEEQHRAYYIQLVMHISLSLFSYRPYIGVISKNYQGT